MPEKSALHILPLWENHLCLKSYFYKINIQCWVNFCNQRWKGSFWVSHFAIEVAVDKYHV